MEILFGSFLKAGPQRKLRHSCDFAVSVTHLVLVRGCFEKGQTCFCLRCAYALPPLCLAGYTTLI
jgi:hypothetical protein